MLRCSHREPLLPASRYVGEHRPSLSPLRDLFPLPRCEVPLSVADKTPGFLAGKLAHTRHYSPTGLLSSLSMSRFRLGHVPPPQLNGVWDPPDLFQNKHIHCMQAGRRQRDLWSVPAVSKERGPRQKHRSMARFITHTQTQNHPSNNTIGSTGSSRACSIRAHDHSQSFNTQKSCARV